MAVELLAYQEGLKASHVPFRGAAPAMQALIAGDVQFMIDAVSTVAPMVKQGRLHGLAVTSSRRSSVLPDLPTMKEAGFPDYETGLWNMLLVPQGTPGDIVARLHTSFQQAIQDPGVRERFAKLGIEPMEGYDPVKAGSYLQKEMRRWAEVIKAGNIEPE
jgi:tripartite-type tricarboxylate transporter receptor subunit TctC